VEEALLLCLLPLLLLPLHQFEMNDLVGRIRSVFDVFVANYSPNVIGETFPSVHD
jgi:hypothetical protein